MNEKEKITIKNNRLTSFLYDLIRDHLPLGVVEKLVQDSFPECTYSNKHLAMYAKELSERLKDDSK